MTIPFLFSRPPKQESFTGEECTGLSDLLSKTNIDVADKPTADEHPNQNNNSPVFTPLAAPRGGGGASAVGARGGVFDGDAHANASGADMSFSFGAATPTTPPIGNGVSGRIGNRNDGIFIDWDTEAGIGRARGPARGGLDFSTPASSNGARRQGAGAGAGGVGVEEDSFDAMMGGSFESATSSMHR